MRSSIADAASPVACNTPFIVFCADTPVNANIPSNLEAPVSDFGVLPGGAVTVGQGATATVSMPVQLVDGAGVIIGIPETSSATLDAPLLDLAAPALIASSSPSSLA